MFSRIGTEIRDLLQTNNGLQICVLHNDKSVHDYLAGDLMSALGITHLYVEFPRDLFEKFKNSISACIAPLTLGLITLDEAKKTLRKSFNKPDDHLSYVVACAIVSKIKVIPIDVHSTESAKVEAIIRGVTPATEEEQQIAFKTRLSHDDSMVTCVKAGIAEHKDAKYLVLNGPMHSGIAAKLDIKSFNIIERTDLSLCLTDCQCWQTN